MERTGPPLFARSRIEGNRREHHVATSPPGLLCLARRIQLRQLRMPPRAVRVSRPHEQRPEDPTVRNRSPRRSVLNGGGKRNKTTGGLISRGLRKDHLDDGFDRSVRFLGGIHVRERCHASVAVRRIISDSVTPARRARRGWWSKLCRDTCVGHHDLRADEAVDGLVDGTSDLDQIGDATNPPRCAQAPATSASSSGARPTSAIRTPRESRRSASTAPMPRTAR